MGDLETSSAGKSTSTTATAANGSTSTGRRGSQIAVLLPKDLHNETAANVFDDEIWKHVTGVVPSTAGMNGVVFVRTKLGVAVLKASVSMFIVDFAIRFAQISTLLALFIRQILSMK